MDGKTNIQPQRQEDVEERRLARPAPRVVYVRPCQRNRRVNHLQRYRFRGVDELRRQQADAAPRPAPGADLDAMI